MLNVIQLMSLPDSDTPLYNHPLPDIETWLRDKGCQQNQQEPHRWSIQETDWEAQLWLDIDQLTVRYLNAGESGKEIQRSFKYSLSRQDIEDAVFSGP